jgi:nicotinamide mononucleotide transporter
MSLLELIAVMLGVGNIALLVRRSIWNYPFGIAMVALYFLIFWEAKLYSDMLLQLFFLVVQLWGWWAWARAGGLDGPVTVLRLSWRERWLWLAAVALAALLWGEAMDRWTDAVQPHWDACVAMGSIAAQILLTRRRIENWIGWITVDIIAIALYANRELWLTSGLYALFLVMSIIGYREWRKAESAAAQHAGDAFA